MASSLPVHPIRLFGPESKEKQTEVLEAYLKSGYLSVIMKRISNETQAVLCMNNIWLLLLDDDVGMLAQRLLVPKFTELIFRVKDFSGTSEDTIECESMSLIIFTHLMTNSNKEEKRILVSRSGVRTLAEIVMRNHDKHKTLESRQKSLGLMCKIIFLLHKHQIRAGSAGPNPLLAGATRVILPLIDKILQSFLRMYPEVNEYYKDLYTILVGEDALLQYFLTSEQSGDILLLVKTNIVSHLLDIYKKQLTNACEIQCGVSILTYSSVELCFRYIGRLKISVTKERLPYVQIMVQTLQIKYLATCNTCPSFYDNFHKMSTPYCSYGENIMYFLSAPGSSEFENKSPHVAEYQQALLESGAPKAMIEFILLCVNDPKVMNNLYTIYSILFTHCDLADIVDQLVSGYDVLLQHCARIDRNLKTDRRFGKEINNVYDSIVLSLGNCLANCSNSQKVTDLVTKSDLFDVLAIYLSTKCTPDFADLEPVFNIFTTYKIAGIEPRLIAEKTPKLMLALWTKLKSLAYIDDFVNISLIFSSIGGITNSYLPYVINTITDVKPIEDFVVHTMSITPEMPIFYRIFGLLPTVWTLIKRDPPGPVIEALVVSAKKQGFTFLPYNVSSTKSKKNKKKRNITNPVENKAKLYKYLNESLTKFLDNPNDRTENVGEVLDLQELSEGLVTMVKSYTSDEELYALEDLASPVMWLASKTDIEDVINNVKKFIDILHSE